MARAVQRQLKFPVGDLYLTCRCAWRGTRIGERVDMGAGPSRHLYVAITTLENDGRCREHSRPRTGGGTRACIFPPHATTPASVVRGLRGDVMPIPVLPAARAFPANGRPSHSVRSRGWRTLCPAICCNGAARVQNNASRRASLGDGAWTTDLLSVIYHPSTRALKEDVATFSWLMPEHAHNGQNAFLCARRAMAHALAWVHTPARMLPTHLAASIPASRLHCAAACALGTGCNASSAGRGG